MPCIRCNRKLNPSIPQVSGIGKFEGKKMCGDCYNEISQNKNGKKRRDRKYVV